MYIISGASSGIGKYLIESFSKFSNDPIIGLYNNNIPAPPNNSTLVEYHKLDLTNEECVKTFVNNLDARLKNIKLVHCAGINHNAILHKTEYKTWRDVITTNLDSAFLLARYLLPSMRDERYGRLIFLSSVVPQIGVPGTSSYAASKAGLKGLMKTIVKENSTKNITCNILSLGYFDIGMIKDVPQKMLDEVIKNIPMGKLGNPVNIFNAVKFALDSDYLTGSEININGGMY